METFEILESSCFQLGFYSQKAPEKTGPNEDSLGFVLHRNKAILVVADGVGGAPKGEEASQAAVSSLVKTFSKEENLAADEHEFRHLMIDAIEKAQENIVKLNNGARSTLTACGIHNGNLRSYQIGDSSLLVCGQKGLLKYKATEHSPTGFAVEAGLMTELEAMSHPDRNIVSNVMGEDDMHIGIGPEIELAEFDTILVASDGLFDNYTTDELIEIIRKESLQEVMQQLVTLGKQMLDPEARKKLHKTDDLSFIVCRRK